MNIVEEPIAQYEICPVDIIEATYSGNYCISFVFSDGATQEIAFLKFLSSNTHPAITKYLDKNLFKQFSLRDGNIDWNNYDMIFPIEDLYNGEI